MVPKAGLEPARHYEYQGFTGYVVHRWHTSTVKTEIISGISKFKF
jgi:hypothetical protein